jgi:prepilin-type N-terminal cleavage/methylation domain-containing protein
MKKGFALIEVIIALALASALICTEITALGRYMKIFRENAYESRDSFYINEAFAFIEYIVEEALYAEMESNAIKLERRDGTGTDWIRRDSDGNLLISYGSRYSSTTNNIMKNISAFEVRQTGKTFFITIITKKEKVYNKCILINAEKTKKDLSWCIHF